MYVTKKKNKRLDLLTTIIGIGMPIVTLPQLYSVWRSDNVGGASLITWTFFAFQAAIFAAFAMKHKEKPLIITYIPLSLIEFGVVAGILVNRY